MKRIIWIVGLLSFLMVCVFSFGPISASSTTYQSSNDGLAEKVLDASRHVVVMREFGGRYTAPDTIFYEDSLGYSGNIPLVYSTYNPSKDITTAKMNTINLYEGRGKTG